MLLHNAQKKFDFEQPDWSKDPELYIIHQILEQRTDVIKLAEPCFPNLKNKKIGRTGLTLEQTVRCAIYKQFKRLKYRELSLHTADSKICIVFTNMEYGQSFSHQTLQEVISKITPDVLSKITIEIGKMAMDLGVDTGKKLRTDSTAIQTNIHHPTNCSLLWDCVRVSCRILRDVRNMFNNIKVSIYSKKTAKKLAYTIVNTRGQEKRIPLFKKMLRIQKKFQDQVIAAIDQLQSVSFEDKELEKERQKKLNELTELLPKMETIYNAAYRKEILDEKVPVDEKLFSIFEDHTDCIKKGKRDVIFGHKVNFTTGKSGIIFDTIIEKGNPPDSSFYDKTLDNMKDHYCLVPRDFATDGGFASLENMDDAKERGIENIVFTKTKGKLQNKVSSKKMETMLKKWRAGIEANISNFKRGLDAGRATWKGYQGFERFVLWSVIAYNLRMLAASLLMSL